MMGMTGAADRTGPIGQVEDGEPVEIRPFRPQDQALAKELILAGLAEHWGQLDPVLNPDLNDIATAYAGAAFLVAWRGGRLVGTGALVPRSPGVAEVVRMSVARPCRRQGIGRLILVQLCEHARLAGYCRVILETTSTWQDVIEFYRRFGFRETHRRDGDTYFAIEP
jgi:GNAT superfamily N-acetyltransferase